jgi:uncharacterized UPF0160 family protein
MLSVQSQTQAQPQPQPQLQPTTSGIAADVSVALQSFCAQLRTVTIVPELPQPAPIESASVQPFIIGTHNGKFHADEAFACALQVAMATRPVTLVRTRDAAQLARCDVIFDVGGVCDPALGRFDHHQRTFSERFDPATATARTTPMAAAGLAFRALGRAFLTEHLPPHTRQQLDAVVREAYASCIEGIDAMDNGWRACNGPPNYFVADHVSAQVGKLNRLWDAKEEDAQSGPSQNERFRVAMLVAIRPLFEFVAGRRNTLLKATPVVLAALTKARAAKSRVLELDGACKWPRALQRTEEVLGLTPTEKMCFCIFGDESGSEGSARVQTIWRDVDDRSLGPRMQLPAAWAGLSAAALDAVTGMPGGIFCHRGRFICGHRSRAGARQMARKAMQVSITDRNRKRRMSRAFDTLARALRQRLSAPVTTTAGDGV